MHSYWRVIRHVHGPRLPHPIAMQHDDMLLHNMRSSTFGGATSQTTAGAAVAGWYGRRFFASEGEGASLRQSADHHLQANAARACTHALSVHQPLLMAQVRTRLCCSFSAATLA